MIDQEEIHKHCLSDDPIKRIEGLNRLKLNFSILPDKQKAWNELIKLTSDENTKVRLSVANTIHPIIFYVPDKQQVWNDLIKLCYGEFRHFDICLPDTIAFAFTYVPDKYKAWNDLHKLTKDKDPDLRCLGVAILTFTFDQIQDKKQAWKDLHRLTNDKNPRVRHYVAGCLSFTISSIPDKQHAWEHLIKLTRDENFGVQKMAARDLCFAVLRVPNKQKAWNDLIKLTSREYYLQYFVCRALGYVFSEISNKQKAWEELHKLTKEYTNIREGAAFSLGCAYPYVPSQEEAWETLHGLTNDEEGTVRGNAAKSLGYAFSYISNKDEAWKDLHKLANDEHWLVRIGAAEAIGTAFSMVSNKEQTWEDLHRLLNDKSADVQVKAIKSLYSSFPYISNKQEAFEDLRRLIKNKNKYVRIQAGKTIGHVFADIPDKQRAWEDLVELTTDNDSIIKEYAYYYLGKVSIFKASQVENEDDYRKELERAIEFFEKSSKEDFFSNPSRFCLPFYRTFHTIVFRQKEAKEDVDKCLAEAKDAIRGSQIKELLFGIVETLTTKLKEVQNLENLDLKVMKGELKLYTEYLDRVEELMKDTNGKAPFAIGTIRKGLPYLDRNLKELIEDIKKAAKSACEKSKGTDKEEITFSINKEIQKWEIGSQEEITQNIEDLILILKAKVPNINENKHLLDKIERIREEKNLTIQYESIITIVSSLPIIQVTPKNNSLIDSINAPATIAAFGGFLILEVLNVIYPSGNFSHLTSLCIAIVIFSVTFIIQRKRSDQ